MSTTPPYVYHPRLLQHVYCPLPTILSTPFLSAHCMTCQPGRTACGEGPEEEHTWGNQLLGAEVQAGARSSGADQIL